MTDLIFNISLIILSLGFILMIIYITMIVTNKKCKPCTNNINNSLNQIYDDRPSITYKKMFQNPEVGFGYQDFDEMDNSITISSKKMFQDPIGLGSQDYDLTNNSINNSYYKKSNN